MIMGFNSSACFAIGGALMGAAVALGALLVVPLLGSVGPFVLTSFAGCLAAVAGGNAGMSLTFVSFVIAFASAFTIFMASMGGLLGYWIARGQPS